MFLLTMALWAHASLPSPSAQALEQQWQSLVPALQQHSRIPLPALSQEDWQQISEGKVARYRLPVEGSVDRALGVGWIPHDPVSVWVGALDDVHAQLSDRLTEVWMPESRPERKVLYQHIDVPAPFADRHWVVVVENNAALYAASEGRVWERSWQLDPRGQTSLQSMAGRTELAAEALWTPVNEGGWSLIPMAGGALVVYQVRADIGGNVPEDLLFRFVLGSLDQMVEALMEPALEAPAHYVGQHFAIQRPDGSDVPVGSLKPPG